MKTTHNTLLQKKSFHFFSWAWCILYFALCIWGTLAYQRIANQEPDYIELNQALATLGFAFAYGSLLLWITIRSLGACHYSQSAQIQNNISNLTKTNALGPIQFFASWIIFPVLRVIHHAFPISRDVWLKGVDSWLWSGKSLTEWALLLEMPWLSEVLSFCYFTFYLICLLSAIYFILRPNVYSSAFFHGLVLMYLFGILGYITVPAAGPYAIFPEEFPYPVQGGGMTQFLADIVDKGVTGMDVFPSLHCGITLYILSFYWLADYKKTALCISPLFIGTTIATVYLRYHYGIDLIVGVVLALLVLRYINPFIKDAKNVQ